MARKLHQPAIASLGLLYNHTAQAGKVYIHKADYSHSTPEIINYSMSNTHKPSLCNTKQNTDTSLNNLEHSDTYTNLTRILHRCENYICFFSLVFFFGFDNYTGIYGQRTPVKLMQLYVISKIIYITCFLSTQSKEIFPD